MHGPEGYVHEPGETSLTKFSTGVHTEEYDYVLEEKCVIKSKAIQNKKDCFKHLKSRECIA